jgi:ferritin-like metal-binding protein YciE
VFEEFGKKPSRKKCEGVSGLIEEGEEVINEIENPEVRDSALITAAQKVEHYEMAGYGSARSSAQLLGLRESPGLLQETLDEEGETDKKLIALAEKLNPKPLKSR